MLINFSVKNFKSINQPIHLSFEAKNSDDLEDIYITKPAGTNLRLLKIGIIYGSNASGKTTILKAIDFLRNLVVSPIENKTKPIALEPFLFKDSKENSTFSIEFLQNGVKYTFNLELNSDAILSETLHKKTALVYSRTTDIEKQFVKIDFGSSIKISQEHKCALEANTLWNNTVLGGFFKTNVEVNELKEVTDWFENYLRAIILPPTNLSDYISKRIESKEINKNNVIKILQKADYNIDDIQIKTRKEEIPGELVVILNAIRNSQDKENNSKSKEPQQFELREITFNHKIDENRSYPLPYEVESAGTQRYFQLSGLLDIMIRKKTLFLIDELESSLHPDLYKHFLLTFLVNSNNSQILTTTHFREFLMERDNYRNDAIWFTELKEDGSTSLFSLSDFDSSTVRNTTSIFNAYKSGKLGARPDIFDYYIDIENE